MLYLWTSEEVAEALKALFPEVWVEQNLIEASPQFGLWLVEWTSAFELRKLTVSYARTPSSGVPQDPDMTTHHFLNLTAGVPDDTWITSDYTTVEGAFDTFWTAYKAICGNKIKLAEYTWRADGPAYKPFGGSLAPTLRRTARSVVGSLATEALPPQIAISVTERTDAKFTAYNVEGVGTQLRNRWGRFYLPAPAITITVDGRISSGTLSTISAAVTTMYNTCTSAGLIPVVYSPTVGHAYSVTELSVDDIWDVIRSRRYVTPLNRVTTTPTAP